VQSAEKQRIVGEWEHKCKELEKREKTDLYKGREQRKKIERQEQDRDRQADVCHLGQVGALAPQESLL
jgi:hypothetical protein